MLITPDQIRAARALLRLDQASLAQQAGISVVTLRRLEEPSGLSKVAPGTVDAVRQILENAGVEFIDRGVRRLGSRPDAAIKAEIDSLIARTTPLLAGRAILSDDDLYDETGL